MADRYVKREKLDEVEARLKATDEARMLREQERDAAYGREAALRTRIEELEVQAADALAGLEAARRTIAALEGAQSAAVPVSAE